MTPVQNAFLTLLRISLGGNEAPPELTAEQWANLFDLADAHKLMPMVFEVGYARIGRDAPDLAAAGKRRVRNQVILQTLRTSEFLALYRALEEAGATPLVVKGIVCRQLYPKPDHRPSSDEDVLIRPEQFPLCHGVMTRLGMGTNEPDPENAYEVPYRKAGSPLYIELHKHLFPPESQAYGDLNSFFGNPFQPSTTVTVQGQQIRTMHPTDHMTYLLLHAFKHFLHSGFGIRQICDILLYAHHHNDLIDWEWVHLSCRTIRAEKFAAAVFAIGVKHLGFSPVGGWETVNELPLLDDILRAGIYGTADETRLHSSTITLKAASSQKANRSGLLAAVFPPVTYLKGRYPWLKERPYLLPAAWCSRVFGYLRRRSAAPVQTLKVGTERVELLRQYGVIQ